MGGSDVLTGRNGERSYDRLCACALMSLLAAVAVLSAETGMCLVVDQGRKGYDLPGAVYRIDMENDRIVNTTGSLADNAFGPRFSPDGDGFAYTRNGDMVYVCDIDGRVSNSFPCDGKWLSWTRSGIWIHKNSSGKFVLHDIQTGEEERSVAIPDLDAFAAFVSQNETAIGMHFKEDGNRAGAILLDENNRIVKFGPGCSVGPSPDGSLFTNNLWEKGKEHQTMKVWRRDGTRYGHYGIFDILDWSGGAYSWNRQGWSGNSNEFILIPAGKRGSDRYQQYGSTVPWVYNVVTDRAYCFHEDIDADVFWFPTDYFSGSIPVLRPPRATSIALTPSSAYLAPGQSLTFQAVVMDQYGKPMDGEQPFSWSVDNGGTMQGNRFTAGNSLGGPFTVRADYGELWGTAAVWVSNALHRVNCGDNSFTAEGWEPDDPHIVNHSSANDYIWSVGIATDGVSDAAPDDVYKSVYHKEHSYSFPDIPDGTYLLRMHFADQHDNGGRAMRYSAEGATVISNLSIVDEVGTGKALVKDAVVSVADGNGLQLECMAGGGNDVFECGVEILQTGAADNGPVLELEHPSGGEVFTMGETLTIRWRGDPDSVTVVDVFLQKNDGIDEYGLNSNSIGLASDGTGSFTWTIGDVTNLDGTVPAAGENCYIRVADYNKPYEVFSGPFTIVDGGGGVVYGTSHQSVQTGPPARLTAQFRGLSVARTTSPGAIRVNLAGRTLSANRNCDPPAEIPCASGVYLESPSSIPPATQETR